MANLGANEQSFVKLMAKSDEHARRGFDTLLKRSNFLKFFGALIAEGLFDATKNPPPLPVEDGMLRIPYWPALDYLLACAKTSGETGDTELAKKLLQIIRAVTTFRDQDGTARDNYHTFRRFAEMLGVLPTSAIEPADLELVEQWLKSRFDRDLVGSTLDEDVLGRFLGSEDPKDWAKAVQLLRYCTAITWKTRERLGQDNRDPVTAVGEYWLKRLVANHAKELGRKAGSAAAGVLQDRVREVFSEGGRASWSHVFRPAVGPDSQNRHGRDAENILVEGLRDVLLAWCEVDVADAKKFVNSLLKSDVEMLRRTGIFVLSEKWVVLRDLYPGLVGPQFFDSGHLHELYGLLRKHFEGMTGVEKAVTLDAIRKIPQPAADDAESRLKRIQRRWLSAVSGTSYEPAASWLAELIAELGPESTHPDYHVYMESSWGPGPSPYQVQELVSFAENRTIVEQLNAFEPTQDFRGPNREALADALEKAVIAAPAAFLKVLPLFLATKNQFQHSLLKGLKQVWDNPKEGTSVDWNNAWPQLVEFFEALTINPAFWQDRDAEGTQRWVVDAIADMLHAGTRSDEHAYPATLLPRGWSLLQVLLEKAEALDQPGDDPMTAAINSSRGRSVEALFSHALRVCRLADKENGSHVDAWNEMKPVFDAELEKCASGNFEFFTLAGAYLPNLEYLDSAWLKANVKQLFPLEQPQNLACAFGGLTYSQPTRSGYHLLRDVGALDAGLRLELSGRDVREKLIERIVIGYLWGEESIDSPRLKHLFGSGAEDLENAVIFFWTIRGEELEEGQRQRVIDFWERCIAWAKEQPEPPAKLLSSLSGLTWYLKDAAGKNADLLLAIAPYVHIHHHAYEFLEQLGRLVEVSPAEVSDVLNRFIDTHGPFYDYENRMRSLVKRLADLGFKPDALSYCEKLRDMPGMAALFGELTAS